VEGLRDIKGIVEVTDNSFYYFLATSVSVALAVILIGLLIYRHKKVDTTQEKRQAALQQLKSIDFTDVKQSVYDFTLYAHYAVPESQELPLKRLLHDLEHYKYKKEVPQLDSETLKRMKQFIREAEHG
jgi:hypothetical protein